MPIFSTKRNVQFSGKAEISPGFQRLFKERLNTGLLCPFSADFAPSDGSR